MIIWRALEYLHCLRPVICLLMHLVPHILDSNDNGKPPVLNKMVGLDATMSGLFIISYPNAFPPA